MPSSALHSWIYMYAHTNTHIQAVDRRVHKFLTKAMRGPSTKSFKQGFLKNLLLSLNSCRNGDMSLKERKRAVRSSADAAMATARGDGARWPQALLASSSSSAPSSPCRSLLPGKTKRCKNTARRCCHKRRTTLSSSSNSEIIARRLVRKRTKVLRGMIPGGELLDGISLLREAIDYVVHLHAQVGVLRRLSNAVMQISDMSGVLTDTGCAVEGRDGSSTLG